MTEKERLEGLKAVLLLVRDANTCLGAALDELVIRKIPMSAVLMGAVGGARCATKYAGRMIQSAMKVKP